MRLAALCFLLLAVAGCDVMSGPDLTSASGRVVSLSTGAPLAGTSVVLREPGALPDVYGRAVTDAAGRFAIAPVETPAFVELAVNEDPYNPALYTWSSLNESAPLGADMEIGVWEIADLVVYADTDTPLGEGDRLFITTPCRGASSSPVRAGCARGNTENEVRLVVTRGTERLDETRQVVAPLGETTVVRFRY